VRSTIGNQEQAAIKLGNAVSDELACSVGALPIGGDAKQLLRPLPPFASWHRWLLPSTPRQGAPKLKPTHDRPALACGPPQHKLQAARHGAALRRGG